MSGIRTYTRTYTHLLQVGTLQVRDDNVRQRRPVCVAVTESQERTCEVRVATRRAREATLMKLVQGPHGAKQAALPTELLAQVQERVGDEGVATDSATALESRLRRLSHTHSASWHQLGEHSSVDGPERTSNSPHLRPTFPLGSRTWVAGAAVAVARACFCGNSAGHTTARTVTPRCYMCGGSTAATRQREQGL